MAAGKTVLGKSVAGVSRKMADISSANRKRENRRWQEPSKAINLQSTCLLMSFLQKDSHLLVPLPPQTTSWGTVVKRPHDQGETDRQTGRGFETSKPTSIDPVLPIRPHLLWQKAMYAL